MVEKQELLTQEGYNKLEEELEYLKAVKRNGDMSRPKIKDGGKIQNIGVILCLVDGMRL